jgi:hypothetical protein
MKKCWDPNPDNRPNATEVKGSIQLFRNSVYTNDKNHEISKQFEETYKYKKVNLLSIESNHQSVIHPQAIYTSRLLNPYTTGLNVKIDWDESKNDQ